MVSKYENKKLRRVSEYVRLSKRGKKVYVESYYQRYDKPRGARNPNIKVDKYSTSSKTLWLKDKNGRFVGRANSAGRTTAKRVAVAGADRTTNYRERGKYGRLYGRASSR